MEVQSIGALAVEHRCRDLQAAGSSSHGSWCDGGVVGVLLHPDDRHGIVRRCDSCWWLQYPTCPRTDFSNTFCIASVYGKPQCVDQTGQHPHALVVISNGEWLGDTHVDTMDHA